MLQRTQSRGEFWTQQNKTKTNNGHCLGQIYKKCTNTKLFCMFRDLFRGWGAQGFPTPEVDLPSLEFLKVYIKNTTKEYWNMSDFPLQKTNN